MAVRRKKSRVDEMLDELLEETSSPGEILGEGGLLNQLTKRLIERALAGELSYQLKQEEEARSESESEGREAAKANSRNGYSKKTVKSERGEMDLEIPRDRQGIFEPILVPKHQRRIGELDEKIIAMYARGLSTRDISAQLQELYGVEISAGLISQVTDEVYEEVKAWQSRPLEPVYPLAYLDALYVNIKVNGRVSKRAVYVVLGGNREGDKELLGLWVGEAEVEGAKFWLKLLNNLKGRGLQDILIACCDGLKGFPQALEAVYPQTQVQLCIVHLIRNSLRQVPYKDSKAIVADLKPNLPSCHPGRG
jgi:putative transposase